jgi:hypothetical protein
MVWRRNKSKKLKEGQESQGSLRGKPRFQREFSREKTSVTYLVVFLELIIIVLMYEIDFSRTF